MTRQSEDSAKRELERKAERTACNLIADAGKDPGYALAMAMILGAGLNVEESRVIMAHLGRRSHTKINWSEE